MARVRREPNRDDPSEVIAERAIEAIKKAFREEFSTDEDKPNITLVVTLPPDGRIIVATTEPQKEYALEALQLGWGAWHRAIRLDAEMN
jgi:hypothetical protein